MTTYDENGVWAAIFDRANARLTTMQLGNSAVLTPKSQTFDANGVMAAVFDVTTNSIRVVLV